MKNKPYPWPALRKAKKGLKEGELFFLGAGKATEPWQSNVQWPLECYSGPEGKGITTDKHRSPESAQAVCDTLMREGFGCQGEWFPIKAWVSEVEE